MKFIKSSVLVFGFVLAGSSVRAAENSQQSAATDTRPLSRTVGIHVVKRTENPDKTLTLLYRWNDSKLGREVERSVVLNEDTVIGIHGQVKKLSDVSDEALKEPSVATVGADNTTAVILRIGRQMIRVSRDELTPKQIAALEAVAPKPTAASDAALEKRVADIAADLKVQGAEKETRLREILTKNLKAVREAHNAGFAPAKTVRQELNAGLSANLAPEQIESVKNTLTHGMMTRTFETYHKIVPELTAEDDKVILALLKQAREEGLDVKNANELGPVFEPFKTQIEQYITANRRDWKAAYRAYVASLRSSSEKPASTPAGN